MTPIDRPRVSILAAPLLALVACAEVAEPYQLDHPRVIAVRAEPAALAPDAVARLDVLATGVDGPRVVAPSALRVAIAAPAAGFMAADAVTVAADGWHLRAPSAEAIAGARAALGLTPDQPLAVPLTFTTVIDGVTLTADKWVGLGAAAANPQIAAITVDGVDAAAVAVVVGARPRLGVRHDAGAAGVVRWLSSVGDLEDYQRPEAVLAADADARGAIVSVVRDRAGGVAWTIVPATVE
jgi:hypothetical protein